MEAIKRVKIHNKIKKAITFILAIGIFVLPYWLDGYVSPIIKYTVYNILGGVLVYTAQLDDDWYFGGKRYTSIISKLASISFSTYVSHVLLYSCIYYNLYVLVLLPLFPWLPTGFGIALQVTVLLILSFALGEISYVFIEKPYLVYSKQIISDLREKRKTGMN